MAHEFMKCLYLLVVLPKTYKVAVSPGQNNKAAVFAGLTVYCCRVSQRPLCVSVSVVGDNLIVFHTELCQGFPFLCTPRFRCKAGRGLQILSANPGASDSRARCVRRNK